MSDTEAKFSNAMNFALDMQQGEGRTPETFVALVNKYEGAKVDRVSIVFSDNSTAIWEDELKSWKILDP